ncbi:hypothetical protein POM88_032869 [Heracleum sosnowskyi]|uniref:Uncharacterized protein n=1 Tax=Heracleum sosnowskyi TaxID=360622 RepID=A0AAD8I197_9APIA|nr:hypothetical protein POM88_032869 [Heracleum sosnowskyi]
MFVHTISCDRKSFDKRKRFCHEIEIPFDCEQEGRESLFDCEGEEEELKVVIKYKEKAFSLLDNQFIRVNIERKSKVLYGYVKQLVETRNFGATEKIKEMIIGDSKLVDVLEPLVLEPLDEKNFNESTKAIQALVKLMSNERDAISIPVLRTLTRLAYISTDYARFIIENDDIEGACAVNVEPIFSSLKRTQNLAKFLVVVVRRVQLLDDKLRAVVSILNKILEIGQYNLRCIVRACYTLSFIEVKLWILTRNFRFLQYLAWSNIHSRPKKFQKEACDIILNIVADRGRSIKVGFNIKKIPAFVSIHFAFMHDDFLL